MRHAHVYISQARLYELENSYHFIAPGLCIGGLHSASIDTPGFDVIVNVSHHNVRPADLSHGCIYIEWPIFDGDVPNAEKLSALVDLLHELYSMTGARILIHCQAGLNRSSLVTGLLLRRLGHTGDDAVKLIRRARDEACLCNEDFERYVREWTL